MIGFRQLCLRIFYSPGLSWLRLGQLLAALVIFAWMALATPPTELLKLTRDGVLHFIGNFLLMGSVWVAFYGRLSLKVSVPMAVVYSLSIEALQGLTQNRQPDPMDALANGAGILAGLVVVITMEHFLKVWQCQLQELSE